MGRQIETFRALVLFSALAEGFYLFITFSAQIPENYSNIFQWQAHDAMISLDSQLFVFYCMEALRGLTLLGFWFLLWPARWLAGVILVAQLPLAAIHGIQIWLPVEITIANAAEISFYLAVGMAFFNWPVASGFKRSATTGFDLADTSNRTGKRSTLTRDTIGGAAPLLVTKDVTDAVGPGTPEEDGGNAV